jgi:hypothetical protein
MNENMTCNQRRLFVLAANLSLLALLMVFEVSYRSAGWNVTMNTLIAANAIVFLFSFLMGYVRSGAWRFSHKSIQLLDEREMVVSSAIMRIAYAVFTVLVLAVMLVFTLMEWQLDMVLVATLILFAHLLPASLIAWKKTLV